MPLTKRLRRWIASGLTLALLFMQLATAAYACPQLQAAWQPPAMAFSMPDCESMPAAMDADQPQLCKAHCVKDAQGRALSAVPDLEPNPAALCLLMGLLEPARMRLPDARGCARAEASLRPPGGPPLYLSLLVLRH